MEILCAILGLAACGGFGWALMLRGKATQTEEMYKKEIDLLGKQAEDVQRLQREQYEEKERLQRDYYENQLKTSKEQFENQLKTSKEQYEENNRLQKEQFDSQQKSSKEQFENQLKSSKEQFDEQLRAARAEMQTLAQKVMEDNARRLKEENKENMGSITAPLKEAIGEVRKAISESQKDSERHSATFAEQMKAMIENNKIVGEKAEGLANVLRRDNKVVGNMGEIILGDLLASQGLSEGIHYEVQARLRDEMGRPLKNDETGREMQPDVILHYPQGQDAIIDSKVSLMAYERYVNAETPDEKAIHLAEHIKSVRQHANELARKDYSKYVKAPRKAIDFVIMFVPFESSLQLALANDPTLWRDAFEKKVFITGEQNLVGILHIIHIAWVQNQQAENQQKVFGLAEDLIDRLGDFIKRYNDLGTRLEKVNEAYSYANNKLVTGNQSVVKKGRELVDLGAKENPNRKLPQEE